MAMNKELLAMAIRNRLRRANVRADTLHGERRGCRSMVAFRMLQQSQHLAGLQPQLFGTFAVINRDGRLRRLFCKSCQKCSLAVDAAFSICRHLTCSPICSGGVHALGDSHGKGTDCAFGRFPRIGNEACQFTGKPQESIYDAVKT